MFEEEEEPEALRKKWEAEDQVELKPQQCSSCEKFVPGDSFFCLYCGARVFESSGPMGKMLSLIKSGKMMWIVVLVLLVVTFMFIF